MAGRNRKQKQIENQKTDVQTKPERQAKLKK